MKIYKKCPCCGRMVFLLLGSEFGNEVEFGSGFGAKDNMPHGDSSHEGDWNCLNDFLNCLSDGHGKVFISLREKEKGKIPKEFKKMVLEWTEGGYKEEEEVKEKPKSSESSSSQDPWIKAGFTALQKKEWVDVGLGENEAEFAKWLAKSKRLSPEEVLNYGNLEELKGEYERSLPTDWS